MGSSLPPFQTSMSSTLGQTVMGSAMDTQKSSGMFGLENKTTSNTSGSSPLKTSDLFSSGGPGIHTMDHSTGIKKTWLHVSISACGRRVEGWSQESEGRGGCYVYVVCFLDFQGKLQCYANLDYITLY